MEELSYLLSFCAVLLYVVLIVCVLLGQDVEFDCNGVSLPVHCVLAYFGNVSESKDDN